MDIGALLLLLTERSLAVLKTIFSDFFFKISVFFSLKNKSEKNTPVSHTLAVIRV